MSKILNLTETNNHVYIYIYVHLLPNYTIQSIDNNQEEERKSMISSSSSGANSHEKKTRHLQRQSTTNSSRNYYFGENRRRRPSSISSSSTSSDSIVNSKDKLRKNGTQSRDSGFRSPQSTGDHHQQQIYSVSSKSKRKGGADEYKRGGAISPTPTTGSVGQRSVKTTTTTMSAGLTDRPGSPIKQERSKRSAKTSSSDPSPASKEKGASKVSRTPSPFQKLAKLFGPSNQKAKRQQHQQRANAT